MTELGVYIHYSPYLYLAPAFVVIVLFAADRLLFPRRGTNPIFRWRIKLWFVALAFAVLNVANWCSPGWCERFGFPLPYSWWSDAISVMNGRNLTAGTSFIAFVANLTAFLLVVAGLGRAYRRSLAVHSAGDAGDRASDSARSG